MFEHPVLQINTPNAAFHSSNFFIGSIQFPRQSRKSTNESENTVMNMPTQVPMHRPRHGKIF